MRGYIVPKEKPQRCARCPYIDAESLDCTLLKGSRAYETLPEQYKTCPLIEVEIEAEIEVEVGTDNNVGTTDVPDTNVGDMISRQDAIKDAESWAAIDERERHLQENVIEWLKEFPTAELGTNLAEVGTDCISRQAAIQTAHLPGIDDAGYEVVRVDDILALPSAEPQIIRCKDCKHWIPYDWMFSEVWQSQNIDDYPEDEIGCKYCDMSMKANDYCSRAERKEVTE